MGIITMTHIRPAAVDSPEVKDRTTPQVCIRLMVPRWGPSSSARFNYEDPILRSITDLSNRISTLGTQQQKMQDTMAHNT